MSKKGRIAAEYRRNNSALDTAVFVLRLLGLDKSIEDGGPGSGNWGHKGRPGKRGGSGKGGGKQYRGGRGDIKYVGSRGDWLNGLTGERQHEAEQYLSSMKYLYGDAVKQGKSVEQCIMSDPGGKSQYAKRLLEYMGEARDWDEHAGKLIDENLDEDEKRLVETLGNKYGMRFVGSVGLPDDTDTDSWEKEDLDFWYDMKSKAMDGPTSGKEAPDELQYAAGLKERPTPPEPSKQVSGAKAVEVKVEHFPSFMKPKPTKAFIAHINSVEDRDPEISEMYSRLGDMAQKGIPAYVKQGVMYSDSQHEFRLHVYALDGRPADFKIRIPKMTDAEYVECEAATTAHELGHFIDFLCRDDADKSGDFSYNYVKEFSDLRIKHGKTSEEVEQLFSDTLSRCNDTRGKVYEKWKPVLDDIYAEAARVKGTRRYNELVDEEKRVFAERKKEVDKEERKAAGGVAPLMDIYQALGDQRRRFGHGKLSTGNWLAECWADWCELSLVYPNERKILEKEKPEFCELMKKMTKDVLGRFSNGSVH